MIISQVAKVHEIETPAYEQEMRHMSLRKKIEFPKAGDDEQKSYVFGIRQDAPKEIAYLTVFGFAFHRRVEHPDNSLTENRGKEKEYTVLSVKITEAQRKAIFDKAKTIYRKHNGEVLSVEKWIYVEEAKKYELPKYSQSVEEKNLAEELLKRQQEQAAQEAGKLAEALKNKQASKKT